MIPNLYTEIARGVAHQSVLLEGNMETLFAECVATGTEYVELTLYPIKSDVWTIDHSRSVATAASRTTEKSLCIIIAANMFTLESQHALLKVTEEALPKTFFVILTHDASALIPTLRSRLLILKGGEQGRVYAKKFLSLPIPARLTAIGSALESPDHCEVYTLISELSSLYAHNKTASPASLRVRTHLTHIRTFLSTHPKGMRQLLEHLALTLPNESALLH